MPIENALVTLAAAIAPAGFVAVLAWAKHGTRNLQVCPS